MRKFLTGVAPGVVADMPTNEIVELLAEKHVPVEGMPSQCRQCREFLEVPMPYPCGTVEVGARELRDRAESMRRQAETLMADAIKLSDLVFYIESLRKHGDVGVEHAPGG